MPIVYLGLGSNFEPEKNLRLACRELRSRFSLQIMSAVYRSAAIGFEGADFLNAVACVETGLSPRDVYSELEIIHELAGRQRGSSKLISRALDIDLLLYDQLVLDEPPVRVPREDILRYGFVLRPLAEIAPDCRHPVTGRSIGDHWQQFDASSQPMTAVSVIL